MRKGLSASASAARRSRLAATSTSAAHATRRCSAASTPRSGAGQPRSAQAAAPGVIARASARRWVRSRAMPTRLSKSGGTATARNSRAASAKRRADQSGTIGQERAGDQARLLGDEGFAVCGLGVGHGAVLQLIIDRRAGIRRRRRGQRVEGEVIFRVVSVHVREIAGGETGGRAGPGQIALPGAVGEHAGGEERRGRERAAKRVRHQRLARRGPARG